MPQSQDQPRGVSLLQLILSLLLLTVLASVSIPLWFARGDVTLENAMLLLARDLRHVQDMAVMGDEELTVVYWADDGFVPEALVRIDRFLRDFRNDAQHEIDPELLDVLYRVREETGGQGVYHVISGYRSPETNDMLRGKDAGVAKSSMHLQGRAIDVRLTGVETTRLRDVALSLELGGVGYYRESDFVHLDTGRVRRW